AAAGYGRRSILDVEPDLRDAALGRLGAVQRRDLRGDGRGLPFEWAPLLPADLPVEPRSPVVLPGRVGDRHGRRILSNHAASGPPGGPQCSIPAPAHGLRAP